jgi:hypothetical protein
VQFLTAFVDSVERVIQEAGLEVGLAILCLEKLLLVIDALNQTSMSLLVKVTISAR